MIRGGKEEGGGAREIVEDEDETINDVGDLRERASNQKLVSSSLNTLDV